MGYIQLDEGVPDSLEFTLSLWFRVPQSTLDDASAEAAAYLESGGDRVPMTGIVPLVVFGPDISISKVFQNERTIGTNPGGTNYDGCTEGMGTVLDSVGPSPVVASYYDFSGEAQQWDPSYIGIDCNFSPPRLGVNINLGDGTSLATVGYPAESGYAASGPFDNYIGCSPGTCLIDVVVSHTEDGASGPFISQIPEAIRTLKVPYPFGSTDNGFPNDFLADNDPHVPAVTGDKWHHIIVSIVANTSTHAEGQRSSFGGSAMDEPGYVNADTRITGASQMWISYDDSNQTGPNLSRYNLPGSGSNDVVTPNALRIAETIDSFDGDTGSSGCFSGRHTVDTHTGFTPIYDYSCGPIPIGRFLIPAGAAYINNIRKVEMSDLQFYSGLSLDTGVDANRRLFVTDTGVPADNAAAIATLGQTPDIAFVGGTNAAQRNFINGINSGSAGNFSPTGTINPYSPGPSIGG